MEKKKKILVFIDWFLPGYKAGGPIQSCANLIEHLKDEYDFSVVTRNTDYIEIKPYLTVKSDEWNVFEGYRVYYFSQARLHRWNIKRILNEETYDAVYLNGIYSLYFSLLPLYYLKFKRKKKVIIAARGMLAQSAIEVKKNKKQLFLRTAKIIRWFNRVTFHATNEEESLGIKLIFGKKINVKVAPNLTKKAPGELKQRTKIKGELKLVSIARISPEKNLKYALEALSKMSGKIDFDIYGPIYAERYWEDCKAVIKDMHQNVTVRYMESIPSSEVEEVLGNYHFLLMPTQGENFGHVIFESLATGCPVIISDQTPWKNLEKKRIGWDVSLNDEKKMLEVIHHCLSMDEEEYNFLSKAAFAFAKANKNNAEAIEANRQLFA